MSRERFLAELKDALWRLPEQEVLEIVADQEEYIRDAVQAGRNETEIIRALGHPKLLAASLSISSKIDSAERSTTLKARVGNTFDAVIAILALAPLNLIFVLGPYLTIVVIIITLWVTSLAVMISSVCALIVFALKIWVHADFWKSVSLFFLILTGIGMGGVGILLMTEITKVFTEITLHYLKWNLNFIQRKRT